MAYGSVVVREVRLRMPTSYSLPLEDEFRITEQYIIAAARSMLGQ